MASKKVKVDFTGVESFQRPSEGQHVVKIVSAEVKQSQGGNDMIVVAFEVTKGQDKGARVYENYPLAENALWKLKGMLQAIGMKCDGKVQLDLDKLIGKVCIVEVIDDEYNGQTRSKVQECRKLAATAEKDDEDEDDDDEVEEDLDEEEDEEGEEEEEAPKKPAKKAAPKTAAKKSSKKPPMNPPEEDEDDEDDEDWDDDEDDEEEPAPKKKAAKKPAPAKKPAKKAPAKKKPEPEDDEDDDDEDWEDED